MGARNEARAPGALVPISALRVPIFAEIALPFAVLFGILGAFLGLSRKLGLDHRESGRALGLAGGSCSQRWP